MIIEQLSVGPIATNCYILYEPGSAAVIIDPGAEGNMIMEKLDDLPVNKTAYIVYTHGHWDHTGAAKKIKENTDAEVLMSQKDMDILHSGSLFGPVGEHAEPDRFINHGDLLKAGAIELEVISTPGHTPGGISLYSPGILFSGDTLFRNSVGRSDLPGGDARLLTDSIKDMIYCLPDKTEVYPGHGPSSTIAWEKHNNPFCRAV